MQEIIEYKNNLQLIREHLERFDFSEIENSPFITVPERNEYFWAVSDVLWEMIFDDKYSFEFIEELYQQLPKKVIIRFQKRHNFIKNIGQIKFIGLKKLYEYNRFFNEITFKYFDNFVIHKLIKANLIYDSKTTIIDALFVEKLDIQKMKNKKKLSNLTEKKIDWRVPYTYKFLKVNTLFVEKTQNESVIIDNNIKNLMKIKNIVVKPENN